MGRFERKLLDHLKGGAKMSKGNAVVKIRVPETVQIGSRVVDGAELPVKFAMTELLTIIADTYAPFRGGLKELRRAQRMLDAFEGAQAGDVVELETGTHEELLRWLDKPTYVDGAGKTCEGNPLTAMVARKCLPYLEALRTPVEEPAEPSPPAA